MTDMTRPKFYDEEGIEKQVIGKDSGGNVEDITVENITAKNINSDNITAKNMTANAIKSQSLNINQDNLTVDSTGKLDSKANINTSEAVNCKTVKATEGINVNNNFTVDNTGKITSKNNIETTQDIVARSIHVNTDKFVVDQNGHASMRSLGINNTIYQTDELHELLLTPTSESYTGIIRAIGFTSTAIANNVTADNTIFLTFNGVIKDTVAHFLLQQNYHHGPDIYFDCCSITNPNEKKEIQFRCIGVSLIGVKILTNLKY